MIYSQFLLDINKWTVFTFAFSEIVFLLLKKKHLNLNI